MGSAGRLVPQNGFWEATTMKFLRRNFLHLAILRWSGANSIIVFPK
jgi:hypothetical protein